MLTIEEVRARGIALPTDDGAAYGVIDEMEAWLATRIGPLDGERTETFLLPNGSATLRLRRPTDEITVTDNAVTVTTVELRNSLYVLRTEGYWTGPIAVTSSPIDEINVRGVLFGLLRLESTETGFESETTGSYSYTRSKAGEATGGSLSRWALLRRLLPRQTFDSVPIRSGFDRPYPFPVLSADYTT